MKRSVPLALFVALGAPGCYFDLGGEEPEPVPTSFDGGSSDAGPSDDAGSWSDDSGSWSDVGVDAPAWDEPFANSLDVTSVAISGTLGAVSAAPDGEFYVYGSSGGDTYKSLDIRSRTDSGVIMNLLYFENANLLEIGQTYQITEYSADRLHVEVVGCSGPSDNVWYADTRSSEVSVDVREGPEDDSAEIVYSVLFGNGDTLEGSFVMPLN